MKIALVVHDFNEVTGQGRYVVELVRRLCQQHEVHIFANRFASEALAGAAHGNLHCHRVQAWRATALTTILTFPLFSARAARREFDIVHTQGFTTFGQPDVMTAHFCVAAWAEARRSALPPRIFARLVTPCERRMFHPGRSRWVIAVSERVKADIARAYGRTTQVLVIRPGVDGQRFHPRHRALYREGIRRRLGCSEKDFLLLYVGDPSKGVDEALRACALLPEVTLVCVSWRPPDAYRARAKRLGLAGRFIFAGPTQEIEKYYAACDLFFYPTIYDAHGMVIWEAMASGLPVLTSTRAGAAEIIQHLQNGILVDDPTDAHRMAEYIRRAMDDGPWREDLGRAGREAVLPYTWDRTAGETLALYELIAGHKGA